MKLGDIYLVDLPQIGGHEQMGKRPAIILQEDEYNLPTVLIVPLTTKMKALDFAGTILIKSDDRNHLDRESIALAFQLRAIDRKRLSKKIGKLRVDQITKLQSLIKELLGIMD
ncbi:MAG: type II toxin-antitoxin system PemK/MazF family toxin [Euryarchaeota archaeon]|nr:type II toxin-antitoxin system PemK/MazF family toxin [Euryarchaeota archaeon]